MLKTCINKFINFIQWTKKFHFFHAFILPSFFIIHLGIIITSKPFYIYENITIINLKNFVIDYYLITLFTSLVVYYFLFLFAITCQLIFSMINLIIFKNIFIRNNFLLNNKIYNGIYTIVLIYTTVVLSCLSTIYLNAQISDYIKIF